MKMTNILAGLIILPFLAATVACSSGAGGTEAGSTSGTLIVRGTTSSSEAAGLVSKSANGDILGVTDTMYIRTYRISVAPEADPVEADANDSWQDIFDNTEDTSDCVAETDYDAYGVTTFINMASGVLDLGEAAIEAGEYQSVRVTLCDHIPWSSDDEDVVSTCPSSSAVMDIHRVTPDSDTDGLATVGTYYWSVDGITEGSGDPSAEDPMLLDSSITVTAGETTTLTLVISNSETGDGFVVTQEGDECSVEGPNMRFE